MNLKYEKEILLKGEEIKDLGLSTKVTDRMRLINRNGTFNIVRRGLSYFSTFSIYHWLISMSWLRFVSLILVFYFVTNILFATLYYIGGDINFAGTIHGNSFERFVDLFFFSTQTFTTVGYGRINPVGIYANIISSVESLAGLLSLAVITGVLYGRFVRPVAKIVYSDKALIVPFKDITGFQFRIANKKSDHQMVDVEVELMISSIKNNKRSFRNMKLEYEKISFFTTTWTVNHPIDSDSPLFGLTITDLKDINAEFLILLKGYDDTFAQVVHSRSSYKYDELEWGAKFVSVYGMTGEGNTLIELDRISEYEKVELKNAAI
ncbi:MAG: ion channel [Bacteroidota bacterium]|nr:ion channel [Bacteroidota bacterium]